MEVRAASLPLLWQVAPSGRSHSVATKAVAKPPIGLVQGASQWLLCGVILATACLGKFGGSFVAARLTGLGTRDSAALGILMNTRGLMELIVLNLGLDLRVLTPTFFAMLVLMAVVTTLATAPALHLWSTNPERAVVGGAKDHERTYADVGMCTRQEHGAGGSVLAGALLILHPPTTARSGFVRRLK